MPETLDYYPDQRLLKITAQGHHQLTESQQMIDGIMEYIDAAPTPQKVFIDFTGVEEMPSPDDLLELAQYMVSREPLKKLKWVILVKEGNQEDILSVTRLVSLHGVHFEFFYDRMMARAALGLI